MIGFIEITEKHDQVKMLFPVSRISCIFQSDDGGAFIETGVDKFGESTGIYVEESFRDVVQKVEAASRNMNFRDTQAERSLCHKEVGEGR